MPRSTRACRSQTLVSCIKVWKRHVRHFVIQSHWPALQQYALTAARLGVVGMAVSLPVARALFNICALLMIIGWLLSGNWRQKLSDIAGSWPSLACIGFFAVSLLSLTWADSVGADQWSALKGYSRLLYVPLIVSLITTAAWQRRAWTALLAGMLFTFSVFLLDIWFEIPGTQTYGTYSAGYGVFQHHIAQGMVLSFLGAWGLHNAIQVNSKPLKCLWFILSLSVLISIFSIGQSRTGQISAIAAYITVFFIQAPKNQRLKALAFALIASCLLFYYSTRVQERFSQALHEGISFQINGENTSIGARLKAWEFSHNLIKQSPWIGHGTGSYRKLAHNHFIDSPICDLGVCEQPHNQFIATGFEMGLIGILSLLAIFILTIPTFSKARSQDAAILAATLIIILITTLMDSSLKIQAQSFFIVTVLGLFLASKK